MSSLPAPGTPSTNGTGSVHAPRAARRRPDERRVLLIGLGLSIALHLLFLAVSRFVILFGVPEGGVALPPLPVPESGGMEVVEIRPVADPLVESAAPAIDAAPPIAPRPDVVDPRPVPPLAPGQTPAPTPTPARDRFAEALEALRPRLLDPRLRPGGIDALRNDEERAALRAYARINALNDSILAQMERERRATDWTFTDDEGRRWGVSPGKLHLGGIEIPLPLTFAPTPEQRARILEWQEIQAQAEQGAIDETFDERARAIREQREAERAE